MSIFKTKELWSYSNANSETYTTRSLAFYPSENILPSKFKTSLIFTASVEGNLRLFHAVLQESNSDGLLLELDLKLPILQIEVGKFSSGGHGPQIAVLHPRQLSVYSLVKSSTASTSKSIEGFQLNLVYQHKLSRAAYSMCSGAFGGVQNKDYICVQSIDGTLNLFENESFSFSRFLPGFLLPGPMAYVGKTDSFVTVSSSYQLESYRYQTLATATDDKKSDGKSDNIVSGKKLNADWVLGLGEPATQIEVVMSTIDSTDSKAESCKIVVLGVKNIFVLHHTGVLVFLKKLDFPPVCMMSYPSAMSLNNLMKLVATDTETLLVFEATTLKWAAQLPFVPLMIKRGHFMTSEETVCFNVLVLLSRNGDISVCALGTDPTLYAAPRPDARPINYEEADVELASLNSIIKASQTKDPNAMAMVKDELSIKIEVTPHIEQCYHSTQVTDEDGVPMVRVQIEFNATAPLSKIRVGIDVTEPLVVTKSSFIINSLTDVHKTDVTCYLFYPVIPTDMNLTVTAAYISGKGIPVVITNVTCLPLRLIVKPCAPIKEADYKVTISTNKPAISLLDLFPEFILDSTMSNAAGFQYFGGPYVTVLSSKTSQRYRLQSDNLACLWLLVQSLYHRLSKRFSADKMGLECSYSSSLPLHEYYSEIEMHFHKRKKLVGLQEQLGERAAQFRAIQKRLLSRFKDKNPTPLTNLDTLLEGTYRQLQHNMEALEQAVLEVKRSNANLSCITSLLVFLIQLSTGMVGDEVAKVQSALTPIVQDNLEQGWQETTDAALTFLLRTSLAKAGKENQGATPITLEAAKDTTRIKKHISSVVDRITKGSRISDEKNRMETPSMLEFSMDKDEMEEKNVSEILNDVNATPIGSHFGEAGERLRSAKHARVRSAAPAKKSSHSNLNTDEEKKLRELAMKMTQEEEEAEKHIINDDNEDATEDDIW